MSHNFKALYNFTMNIKHIILTSVVEPEPEYGIWAYIKEAGARVKKMYR